MSPSRAIKKPPAMRVDIYYKIERVKKAGRVSYIFDNQIKKVYAIIVS